LIRCNLQARQAKNRVTTQKRWICPLSTDKFMVVQSHPVFRELHMLVDCGRLSWGELSQDGHALLLVALCCPDEHVQNVVRRWVAAKTHYGSEDCNYDALEELSKGAEPALFVRQANAKVAGLPSPHQTEETERRPLGDLCIEKAHEDSVIEDVMAALKQEGYLHQYAGEQSNSLGSSASLSALMSKEVVEGIIEQAAPKLMKCLSVTGHGSRRHLLQIVHEQLERSRHMGDLDKAIRDSLYDSRNGVRAKVSEGLRKEAAKRCLVETGAGHSDMRPQKKPTVA